MKQTWFDEHIPHPKSIRTLPGTLSADEVTRMLEATQNPKHWTILATFYATALRISELQHLKVDDIDSKRMVVHVLAEHSSQWCAKSIQSAASQTEGAINHNRTSCHRLLTRMNAAQDTFTRKKKARMGQPEVAHPKGSPVIEEIPISRSSEIAQLADTAIKYPWGFRRS